MELVDEGVLPHLPANGGDDFIEVHDSLHHGIDALTQKLLLIWVEVFSNIPKVTR